MRIIKSGRRLALAAVMAVGLAALGGCRPSGAGANSPQGKELASILETRRVIPMYAPGNVPIAFRAIDVEKWVESNGAVRYRAVTLVSPRHEGTEQQRVLRGLVKAKYAITPEQEVRSVTLRVEYRDANGQVLDSESVSVPLTAATTVILPRLGANGSPHRITTRVESFEIVIPEKTRVVNMS